MTLIPQNNGFSWIFRDFGLRHAFQEWIAPKWLEIDQDKLRTKFLALNVDFSSRSPNPLRSRRVAQASIKGGTLLKSGYLSVVDLSNRLTWKYLKICTDMLLIITSTSEKLLRNINIDDLKWPWTLKILVLVNFMRFLAAKEWIATKWIEIDQDYLQTGTAIGSRASHEH